MTEEDRQPGDAPARIGASGVLRAACLLVSAVLTIVILKIAMNMGTVVSSVSRLEKEVGVITKDLGAMNSRMHMLAGGMADNQARFAQDAYSMRVGIDRMSVTLQSVSRELEDLGGNVSTLKERVGRRPPAGSAWQQAWPR